MKALAYHLAMLLVGWFFEDMHPSAEQLDAEGMAFGSAS